MVAHVAVSINWKIGTRAKIYWTNVACQLLDHDSCRCKDYENRQTLMPDCIQLTRKKITELSWLPPTCAYRLLDEENDLPSWHPLLTGSSDAMHEAGISVRGRVIAEEDMDAEDLENHIVDWPREIL